MSDFAERIAKRNAQFFERVNKSKRSVTFGILSQVVLGTPVGNTALWKTKSPPPGYVGGRARGNWQVTTGQPAQGEKDVTDKSGAGTIRLGNAVIGRTKLEDDIWISNNLPYIYRLAFDGWSKQINRNWFRQVIDNFKGLIQRAWGGSSGER